MKNPSRNLQFSINIRKRLSRFRVLAIGETRRRLLGEEVGKFRRIWICMESVGTPRTGYRIMRLRSRSF